jgi:cytochrome c oxidase subunit 4
MSETSSHIVPLRIYFTIFAALMVLTVLTVWIATIDLGALSTPVALAIAVTKALLVVLYFMHVRYSTGLTQIAIGAGVLFLVIMIVLTMGDIISRGWLGTPGS